MEYTFCVYLDGTIHGMTLSGPIDGDALLGALRGAANDFDLRAYRGYLADLSGAQMGHLSFEQLREIARARNELRATIGDSRPTAVIAPNQLTYGLARIAAAFDRAPMRAFRSKEAALSWLVQETGLEANAG